jgi:transposase-like protein
MPERVPAIGHSWRRAWGQVIQLFAFPPDIRKIDLYDQRA